MKRREFVVTPGAALAGSRTARAQAMPVITFLNVGKSAAGREASINGLRKGLADQAVAVYNIADASP
jgi:hypothetical protein